MAACQLFTIRGRVQGVFFRDSTRRVAQSLHISGYAINLADGNVEVLAYGEPGAIDKLAAWLHEGPQMARVDEVNCEVVDVDEPKDFQIG